MPAAANTQAYADRPIRSEHDMSMLPVKFMQEEDGGGSCSHLEREMRVVRRLNGDVQHGGQHCTMQGSSSISSTSTQSN